MERSELLNQLYLKLREYKVELLMDKQSKFCGPCGGMKSSLVYRSPKAAEIGMLLDQIMVKS